VFTDLERLTPEDRERAAYVWRALATIDPPLALLNHPLKALRRYELLRRLKEAGLADFDVYRGGEFRRPASFPVFIRKEDDHLGPETDLIASQLELDTVLDRMTADGRCVDARLIVEYRAEAGADGLFRKYGAFCVRGRVIPRHVLFAKTWMVKGASKIIDDRLIAEEREYLTTNPHAEQIAAIFSLAHIDYGRIDYAIVGGRVQVYEINTNPTIINAGPSPRNEKKERFSAAFTHALLPLAEESANGGRCPSMPLDPPLKDRRGRLASIVCQRLFGRQFRSPI
jgi:hypothetical protein